MNYIVLDIVDDIDLAQSLQKELSQLLNWFFIHSSKNLALYTLGHDLFVVQDI